MNPTKTGICTPAAQTDLDLPDVSAMRSELIALRAAFLVNTTKLATIAAAVGINADLGTEQFADEVKKFTERTRGALNELKEWRKMAAEITSPPTCPPPR